MRPCFRVRRQLREHNLDDDVLQVRGGFLFPHPDLGRDLDRFDSICNSVVADPGRAPNELVIELRELHGGGLLPGLRTPWLNESRQSVRQKYEVALGTLSTVIDESTGIARPLSISLDRPDTSIRTGGTDLAFQGEYRRLMELATGLWNNLYGVDREFWFQMVESSLMDIRGVLDWALKNEKTEIATSLAGQFYIFWYTTARHSEGRRYAEQALAIGPRGASKGSLALTKNAAAMFAAFVGELDIARRYLEEAMELWVQLDDKTRYASALHDRALIAGQEGELSRGLELDYQSIDIHRNVGDADYVTKRLADLAQLERASGNLERSNELLEESKDRAFSAGGYPLAHALQGLALNKMHEFYGDADDAVGRIERSELAVSAESDLRDAAELFDSAGSRRVLAYTHRFLGVLQQWLNRFDEASDSYKAALDVAVSVGDMAAAGMILRDSGDLKADTGNPVEGQRLAQQGLSLLRAVGHSEGVKDTREVLARIAAMIEQNGNASDADN